MLASGTSSLCIRDPPTLPKLWLWSVTLWSVFPSLSDYLFMPASYKCTLFVFQGGMVARSLFALPDFDRSRVHTLLTLAAPHQSPVLTMDATTSEFYANVNDFWRLEHNASLADVTVVATGGGFRDILVRSDLTNLRGVSHSVHLLDGLVQTSPNFSIFLFCHNVQLADVEKSISTNVSNFLIFYPLLSPR